MTGTLDLLPRLLRARRFDEALLTVADEIVGHWHSSIGNESTGAALGALRGPDDLVVTNYRNHAHLAGLGSDLAVMYAEILGRDLGPQRGRSGSLHLIDPDRGVLHTTAMVSAGAPLACGQALARKRAGSGMVFCFFGDGAVNEGSVHEALNLASLWALPVLFVCENNAAPAEGRANDTQAAPSLGAIAEANAIPAVTCDGRHPTQVLDAMHEARDQMQAGGPRFVEVLMPVWPGNRAFFPFDATGATDVTDASRTTGEPWSDKDDPVLNACRQLLAEGIEPARIAAVDESVRREVADALARGRTAPRPPAGPATTDVTGSDHD